MIKIYDFMYVYSNVRGLPNKDVSLKYFEIRISYNIT